MKQIVNVHVDSSTTLRRSSPSGSILRLQLVPVPCDKTESIHDALHMLESLQNSLPCRAAWVASEHTITVRNSPSQGQVGWSCGIRMGWDSAFVCLLALRVGAVMASMYKRTFMLPPSARVFSDQKLGHFM